MRRLGPLRIVNRELEKAVQIEGIRPHLACLVGANASHDALLHSSRKHKPTVIVGMLTYQVNTARSRKANASLIAKPLLKLFFNLLNIHIR